MIPFAETRGRPKSLYPVGEVMYNQRVFATRLPDPISRTSVSYGLLTLTLSLFLQTCEMEGEYELQDPCQDRGAVSGCPAWNCPRSAGNVFFEVTIIFRL